MAKRTTTFSIQFAAFISLFLALAPIGDFSVVELSTGLTATTITPHPANSNSALTATSGPRYSRTLSGSKQEPLNALIDELYSYASAQTCRNIAQFDLAPRPEPGQFWISGERSPPTAIL